MFSFLHEKWSKIKGALFKTQNLISEKVKCLFSKPLDAENQKILEKILIEADFGVGVAKEVVASVAERLRVVKQVSEVELMRELKRAIAMLLPPPGISLSYKEGYPSVVLVVGVNGNGKTTTIAKLAQLAQKQGHKVLIGAADTYRAAAAEQLQTWAQRLGCDVVRGPDGGDPAAVAFDACSAAKARGVDLVLIDTAGRLQNKDGLMRELAKISKVCHKALPEAPFETLLVVDATTGQNALDQVRVFNEHTPLSGCILTKVDGSARGGMVVALHKEIGLCTRWLGTGEALDDLELFEPQAYLDSLIPEE